MEALILDRQYDTLSVLDTFTSFIWTDRYQGYGDFQVVMPVDLDILEFLKQDNYLSLPRSDRYMIVENVETKTDVETGNTLTVTGRSLESILERRVIAAYTVLTGNLQDGIQRLLNENAITPINPNRKIPGLTFRASTDPAITALTIDAQYLGENLYDTILDLCKDHDIGFRILPQGTGGFVFELYAGKDRSYDQNSLPPVVFSPSFENLLTSNYLESKKALKTVAIVAGEGEGAARKIAEAVDNSGGGSGLDRREVFVNAGDVSSSDGSEEGMPEATYLAQLRTKGSEALADTKVTQAFEGEIDASLQFVYGKDFFIGDVVQIKNEYGMEAKSRVSELILSQEAEGEAVYPTFVSMNKE